ncbi:MAG TPA: hypothetical protein PKZ42_11455 [Syntrophales bacterium]|nr:hypothetical protein [Syntrophales bacterium]
MSLKIRHTVCVGLTLAMAILLITGITYAGDKITLLGEINDDFQLITDDDQILEIVQDDQGEELVGQAGERVEVVGEIVEEGSTRLIKVLSYKLMDQ